MRHRVLRHRPARHRHGGGGAHRLRLRLHTHSTLLHARSLADTHAWHTRAFLSFSKVLAVVARYNADPAVHGVLVQLPLPAHVNEERVLSAISLEKDVDGFHPINIGRLAMRGRDPLFVPCTPKGAIQLLERSGIAIAGKRAVVIGRSNIVGMPAAMLLQRRDATVTVVHSRTPAPERIIAEADIVIAAVGVPEFVKGAWLKPGCAVIDVGINPVPDASKKTGCVISLLMHMRNVHMLTWRECGRIVVRALGTASWAMSRTQRRCPLRVPSRLCRAAWGP